ncbi:MAG: hypothetical protein AAF628_17545 [Planctomycetota bacterium]
MEGVLGFGRVAQEVRGGREEALGGEIEDSAQLRWVAGLGVAGEVKVEEGFVHGCLDLPLRGRGQRYMRIPRPGAGRNRPAAWRNLRQ